jgi:hypothetical protein
MAMNLGYHRKGKNWKIKYYNKEKGGEIFRVTINEA